MDLPLNLAEYEELARQTMPRTHFDYFGGAAADGITARENRRAFEDLALRYRVFADVGDRDLSITLFGRKLDWPVAIAPMAFQQLAHPQAEIATVKAAGRTGTLFVASTMATTSLEDIAAAATGPCWFQLYVYRDRSFTKALVERAEAVGYEALMVTADTPVLGRREQDMRNRFHIPPGVRIKNLEGTPFASFGLDDGGEYTGARYMLASLDPSLTWKDLEWLCSITRLPVIVKGVVRGDDAEQAMKCGAGGIAVSNHGGRQLDSAIATLRALPDVVQGVAGRGEVLVDGGVRRGTDIVKALALGAKAVLLGRPVIWGLATGGEDGVARLLGLLREEFDTALALCGCKSVDRVTRDLIA